MEKSVVLLCLIGSSGLASADFFDGPRLCPDGYFYAGEDTPENKTEDGLTSVVWEKKIHETDPYSCYKIVRQDLTNSTDEAPFETTFNHVVDVCGDDKAKPVALEDMEEANRLANLMREKGFTGPTTFLTSGVFFADLKEWMWLGSNKSLDTATYNISEADNEIKQCLTASFDVLGGSSFFMTNQAPSFQPVECNKRSDLMEDDLQHQPLMVCEVRAVTVTYLAWFYSNWITFLLVLMTSMLLVALCLSVFKYKGGRSLYANRRVYRADARTTQQPRDLPYGDNPPTYSDVTGIVDETQQSKMDKYKNKGKEILAKVTFYKSTSN